MSRPAPMRSITESASSATTSRRRRFWPAAPHRARAGRSAARVLEAAVEVEVRQAKRGRETEHRPRQHGDRQREEHHPPSMAISCRRGTLASPSAADTQQAHVRQQQSDQAAGDGEHQALGQQLADDAPAAGAERGADGDFLLARERAGEEQVGDVGARDEEHEGHRRHEHQERQAHAPDRLLLQRQHAERQPAVRRIEVWMLAPQPHRQRVELGSRLRDRRARLERRDDVVVLAVPDLRRVGGQRQRQHHLRIVDHAERRHDLARERERRRQHADDSRTADR